jgi:ADP-heptose:LPS heptosyltransferase
LYANFKINYLPQQHIVDRYLATCQTLAVENDGEGLDYFIDECDRIDLKSLPAEFQNGYVAWVIGAKQNTKKFPATKIANTILHPAFPKYPVVLLGGNEDEKDGEKIKAMTHASNISVLNACGKYSLNQSASLLQQAKLVVANDTGLMHIAAAFKKTVISIWGNTVPAFGMSPYYGNREIKNAKIEIENLNCRPCSKLGYSSCPQKHFNCMNMIDEEKLVRQIEMLLRTN